DRSRSPRRPRRSALSPVEGFSRASIPRRRSCRHLHALRLGLAPAPESNAELGHAGLRRQIELALVAAHDRAHERQAQPKARHAAVVGRATALELLVDLALLGASDADAVVADEDLDLAAGAVRFDRDPLV